MKRNIVFLLLSLVSGALNADVLLSVTIDEETCLLPLVSGEKTPFYAQGTTGGESISLSATLEDASDVGAIIRFTITEFFNGNETIYAEYLINCLYDAQPQEVIFEEVFNDCTQLIIPKCGVKKISESSSSVI